MKARVLIAIVFLSLFIHQAISQTQTYIDNFGSQNYGNNDGTNNFLNNWSETVDTDLGPTGTYIYINNGRLYFSYIWTETIQRSLSIPAGSEATLSLSYNSSSIGLGILAVQLYNNTSSSWETIGTIDSSPSSGTINYTLTGDQKSANAAIRFLKDGNDWASSDLAWIDDVKFEVTLSPASITATGDQDFCLSSGNSVAIAESVSITGSGTGTSTVYVQVSSGYVSGEDVLTLSGSHPNITPSWNAVEGKMTLNGNPTALYSEFENAIEAIDYSNSNLAASGTREFSITVGNANFLPSSGHYYEYVPAPLITWTQARDAAAARTYFGLEGYLATLTSADEGVFAGTQSIGVGWIGGSDAHTEGVWRWVTGPEGIEDGGLGRQFWQGRGTSSGGQTTGPDNYAFWNPPNEPNQSGNEDYAHVTHINVGPLGSWNDLANTTSSSGYYASQGYVVEYGGMPGDPSLSISDATQINIVNIPHAGTNGTLDNCSGNVLTETDLFGALGGTKNAGGVWSPAISSGSRVYTYTVSASSPCVGVATANVSVSEYEMPNITGTNPGSSCGTGDVTISATANVGTINWFVSSSGGSSVHTGTSYIINGLASTTTYYVEAQNGPCISARIPVIATIHPVLTVNAGNDETICQNETIVLTGVPSNGSGMYSYEWTIQGSATVLGTNQDISVSPIGDPNVNTSIDYQVKVTDINTGCVSTDLVRVYIRSNPSASIINVNPVCPASNSGSITFDFSDHPNRTNIKFSINGSVGSYMNSSDNAGSYTFSGLSAGSYDVWTKWGDNSCPVDLGMVNLSLDNIPNTNFNYNQTSYCQNEGDPSPNITTAGGTFSSTAGLSINSTSGEIDLSASTSGSYVVTYSISGICGNSSIQNVTINEIPIATVDGPHSIDCNNPLATISGLGSSSGAGYSYNWMVTNGGVISGATNGISVSASSAGDYTLLVANNVNSCSSSVSTSVSRIPDNTNPVFAATPAGITVSCIDDVPAMTNLSWTDNCDGSGTVIGVDGAINGSNCNGTITRTWSYTDVVGNSASTSQLITILDNIAPIASNPANISVQCASDIPAVDISVVIDETDNCDLSPSVSYVSDVSDGGSNPEVITRTYTVTDDCGNSISVSHLITINDVSAPVANVGSLPNITAQCEVTNLTAPTATDNCDGQITGTHNASLPIMAQGTTTVTWTYEDAAGNTSSQIQSVVITDNTAPVANVGSLPNITAQCEVTNLTAPTATDNCDGQITGTH
ncbi:hypothetical protein HNS38_14460, partial [Lentimicrobium sp. L6]|uniref:HYR-like domain-containing protein n=1 Tax=Lentimicrobium sp. L6 TaxID=2735916 RepID=UPI001C12F02B